jgi:hypothetical protein
MRVEVHLGGSTLNLTWCLRGLVIMVNLVAYHFMIELITPWRTQPVTSSPVPGVLESERKRKSGQENRFFLMTSATITLHR